MNRTRIVLLVVSLVAIQSPAATAADLTHRDGKYIRLTTDLDSTTEIDDLVATFDAAVAQWLEFWNLEPRDVADWQIDACVMRDRATFAARGLVPIGVPNFPFGYTLGDQVWVLAQQSAYYTRHLLLHEGAHSLAFHKFRGAGPTWFMEGTAEMLATHASVGDEIETNAIPDNRESVPYWGRFKLIGQLRDENKVPSLETVMRYQPSLLGEVEPYSWSWAATMMLHAYPEYRDAFFAAARNGRDSSPAFNRRLFLMLRDQWPVIRARWRLMCHELDYGFDWNVERMQISERDPVWDGRPISFHVQASQGWQSIGVRIPPNSQVKLSASGMVTLDKEPKPWTTGPAGITFEYHRGRPIGQLIACLLPNATPVSAILPALKVQSVSGESTIQATEFSWLLVRINDSSAGQSDNEGRFELNITR